MPTIRIIAVTAVLSILCSGQHAGAADKYALLVGVTKYNNARMNDTPLQYPEADAEAVAELLKGSGYTVKLLLGKEATKANVDAALLVAEQQGNADGVLLIGLFGHGTQYGDEAYYGTFDTKTRRVKDADGKELLDKSGLPKLEPDPESMVSMKSILATLNSSGAGNRVLLADCCREDPSRARGRAFGSKVKMSDLRRGTAALFSCGEFEQAFEHPDWKHGAFTSSLLERCRAADSQLTVNTLAVDVYRDVARLVRDKTNGRSKQTVTPIINGVVELGLDFMTRFVKLKTHEDIAELIRERESDYVIVNLWSTDCPPCTKLHHQILDLEKRGDINVGVVTIAVDYVGIKSKPPEFYRPRISKFLKSHQKDLGKHYMSETDSLHVFELFEADFIPHIRLYTRDGGLVGILNEKDGAVTFVSDRPVLRKISQPAKSEDWATERLAVMNKVLDVLRDDDQ